MGIQIKKFQAPTLQKAIEQVRAELGDSAIILQTETLGKTKALGLMGKNIIEVTAAIDRKEEMPRFHVPEDAKKPASQEKKSFQGFTSKLLSRKSKEETQ